MQTTTLDAPRGLAAADVATTEDRTTRLIRSFERAIVLVLMALLTVIISLSTLELVWLLVRDIIEARTLLLDVEQMFELFGFFLLVLIGMELLATLKSYLYERVIHVEVVLEVALVAIAQKVIIINTTTTGAPTLAGLAGLVVALAVAFWAVRIARRDAHASQSSGVSEAAPLPDTRLPGLHASPR